MDLETPLEIAQSIWKKEIEKLKQVADDYKWHYGVVSANLEEVRKITQEQIKGKDLKDLSHFEKKLALSLMLVPDESEYWR